MPTFSRHHDHPSDPNDPRRDDRTHAVDDRSDEPTDQLPARGTTPSIRDDADRAASERQTAERAADRAEVAETDRTTRPAPAGPRPRASLLATLSLIAGVAAALFVLSGALAGYGIALGVLALVLAIGGISATGRRHVAGRTDALIGLAFGLAAVVFGILAVSGALSWLTTDTEPVNRIREWLDTQFVDRF